MVNSFNNLELKPGTLLRLRLPRTAPVNDRFGASMITVDIMSVKPMLINVRHWGSDYTLTPEFKWERSEARFSGWVLECDDGLFRTHSVDVLRRFNY